MEDAVQRRKPILVLTDLSARSDAAIQFAGALARMLDADLHVLHAMSLRHRPLRAVMPALNNLNVALQSADEIMRTQVQCLAPRTSVATPVVDLDDAVRAIERTVTQIAPMAVVTPPLWEWRSNSKHPNVLSAASLARIGVPLIILREPRRELYNRVAVVTDPDALDGEVIEAAGRWGFWLERVYADMDAAPSGPEFDVFLLDGEMKARDILVRIIDERADLIALNADTLAKAGVAHELNTLMPVLLTRSTAPIVIMPPRGVAITNQSGTARNAHVALA